MRGRVAVGLLLVLLYLALDFYQLLFNRYLFLLNDLNRFLFLLRRETSHRSGYVRHLLDRLHLINNDGLFSLIHLNPRLCLILLRIDHDNIRILFRFQDVMNFAELLKNESFIFIFMFFLYFFLCFEDRQMKLFLYWGKSFYEDAVLPQIPQATSVAEIVHQFVGFAEIFVLVFVQNRAEG